MNGPAGFRTRFAVHVKGPRMSGWIEMQALNRVTARAEAARAFRGLTVTLYERSDDGFGFIRIGVVSEPAAGAIVEGAVS